MAAVTITISQEAHRRLSALKQGPGDSFTRVILRHLAPPARSGAELLERLEAKPAPPVNLRSLKRLEQQRGRRSPRS
jgi:predicted CopG family antitoxin